MSDSEMDMILAEDSDFDVCGCGCSRCQHDAAGKCRYCFECDGWTYDEMATWDARMNEDAP